MIKWIRISMVLFVCLLFTSVVEAGTNLLQNPGFEKVSKSNITLWSRHSSIPYESVEVVTEDPVFVRSGKHAVKLVQTKFDKNGNPKFGVLYSRNSMPIEIGTKYTLSFWAKGDGMAGMHVYSYTAGRNVSSPPSQVTKDEDSKGRYYVLKNGEQWKKCSYTFLIKTKDSKVEQIRFVIQTCGTVYLDDVLFGQKSAVEYEEKQSASVRKTKAAAQIKSILRSNMVSIGFTSTSPRIDGRIEKGEYGTMSTGMIDSSLKALYPLKNEFFFSSDKEKLYFAISLQVPFAYKLQACGKTRDDPSLIAQKDVFYLFLRSDSKVESKGYKGVYLAVSSDGIIYDAWEDIDWKEARCNRDIAFNANWKVATSIKNNIWTMELSVPFKDLTFSTPQAGDIWLASFGMNLNSKITWQSHPGWFDHYQAFGRLQFTSESVTVKVPTLGEISCGLLSPLFQVANKTGKSAPYELTYLVSTPRMVAGEVGGCVFEMAFDVREQEVIRNKSVFHWNEQGTLKPRESKEEKGRSLLKTPGFYVLEIEAKTGDKTLLYQKIPFNYSPPVVASLSPVPSKEIVKAKLSFYGARPEEKGKVKIVFRDKDEKVVLSKDSEIKKDEMTLPISMDALIPGDYSVLVTLIDKAGKDVLTVKESFKKWETPIWLKDRKGLAALEPDWVPAPWTPMTVSTNRVSLWGRSFAFREGSLLSEMVSQDVPLLASGISIKYLVGGQMHVFTISKPDFMMKRKGRVKITQEGSSHHFSLSVKQQIEFDGMDRFDITISPKKKVKIDKLWIDIPFHNVSYCYSSGGPKGWQAGLISALKSSNLGAPNFLALSNDDVGCVFFTENYKGWLINSAKPRVQVKTADKKTNLELLIVNEPSRVNLPLKFTFGVHLTPVKPFFNNWRDMRFYCTSFPAKSVANVTYCGYGGWNTTLSKPSPRNWKVLEDLVTEVRKYDQRIYPYTTAFKLGTYDYIKPEWPSWFGKGRLPKEAFNHSKKEATRREEYFYFKEDWNVFPTDILQHGGKKEAFEYATVSAGSSYVDYLVHGTYEMLKRTDVDGFYYDCDNPTMNFDKKKNLAYYTKDGVLEGSRELFATRDMYKRLYHVFDALRGEGRKPYLLGHGSPAAAPYMSFWDINFHGEEIKPRTKFEITKLFLQKMLSGKPIPGPAKPDAERSYDAFYYRAGYGAQYGIPVMYLPQYGYKKHLNIAEHSREHLSWTFLHNNILWPAYIPMQIVNDFWKKVEIPFGMGDTIFYPYWKNSIESHPDCIKVSYWKKKGKKDYLVAIANWSSKPVKAKIKLPSFLSGFHSCLDMEEGKTINIKETLEIDIPHHNLKVFRF